MEDETVDLVVTSPPYPMIAMWDDAFAHLDERIACVIEDAPEEAWELMHEALDAVWEESFRVLKDGGFLCINVGDATRTLTNGFRCYDNHSRVTASCSEIGFVTLPSIIWRKPSNSPNKFMGSGTLPCGAYVTQEHEHILIFRKGGKREFRTTEDKERRAKSAFFWEERNAWFSDLWQVYGARQETAGEASRTRNASFPMEIPFRLINMFSVAGDTVLDPFLGFGTTTRAAMLAGRNSVGFEIDKGLARTVLSNVGNFSVKEMGRMAEERLERHKVFVVEREKKGKPCNHFNEGLRCPVVTRQERTMEILRPVSVSTDNVNLTTKLSYASM